MKQVYGIQYKIDSKRIVPYSKAIYCFKKAAQKGNVGAQYILGLINDTEEGVLQSLYQNFGKFVKWDFKVLNIWPIRLGVDVKRFVADNGHLLV